MSAHEEFTEDGERRGAGVRVRGGGVPREPEPRRPVDLLPPLVQGLHSAEVTELGFGSVLEERHDARRLGLVHGQGHGRPTQGAPCVHIRSVKHKAGQRVFPGYFSRFVFDNIR